MMKFSKGETVVEPTIGICTVFGMKIMKVDGQDMTVYIFDAQNAKVYVPADQVEKRGIRRPMTRDDVKRVLASLKRPASPNRADARLQYTNYRDIMKSGDPVKITNLLRDLYILDQNDDLKGKEKEIMDQAKKFLTDEISFVRDVSKTMIAETINEALRGMYKKKIQKDKERAKKSGVGLSMGVLGYEDDEEYEDEEDELEVVAKSKKKKKAAVEEDEEFEEDAEESDETDEGATLEDEEEEEEEFEEDGEE
jgi:CarD family transcriptional regulator